MPSSFTADVRGGGAILVARAKLCARFKAFSVHVVNVATVKVNSTRQRQRATTARVGAAIVLWTGEAFGANLLGAGRGSLYSLTGGDSEANDILTV